MSFYTALTGLNAATAQLGVTSNNIANVGTAGFKRSRADFGDIFATSPLQQASSVVGQGVSLKKVSQEFSQGNIQVSSNALDLAITGDGFFPLKSGDGLQDIYTRNGSFTMNDQYNVVNSAGQALMAATVDSSGKADLSSLNRLTIPKQTSGQAKETSLVELGLNLPADAQVITARFNRNNPATFNKTTAITVYDKGGNNYLATVYYVKTQNASQAIPNNRWQTYVYIGETKVDAALIQATDANQSAYYVNKYGQLATREQIGSSAISSNTTTQMFVIDDLTDTKPSIPASVSGESVGPSPDSVVPPISWDLTADRGLNFTTLTDNQKLALKNLFKVDIDGSGHPVTVDLSELAKLDKTLNGNAIASFMTTAINKQMGDDNYFDFSANASAQKLTFNIDLPSTATTQAAQEEFGIDLASQTKQVKLTFAAATAAGVIQVAGYAVTLTGAETKAQVATKVKDALNIAFASQTPSTGRSIKFDERDVSGASLIYAGGTRDGEFDDVGLVSGTVATATTATVQGYMSAQQKLVFGDASAAGTITVAGVEVDIAASDKAVDVARKVKAALVADNFITGNPGRSVDDNVDGTLVVHFAQVDINPEALEYQDTGTTGVTGQAYVSKKYYGLLDKLSKEDAASLIEQKMNTALQNSSDPVMQERHISVNYDAVSQGFRFVEDSGLVIPSTLSLHGGTPSQAIGNAVLGMAGEYVVTDPLTGSYTQTNEVLPNGDPIRLPSDTRFGAKVVFDSVNLKFAVQSGTTGDSSSVQISAVSNFAANAFGLMNNKADVVTADALRGIPSKPAVAAGTQIAINVNNNFGVDETTNTFVVTVDGVKGSVKLPINGNYTLDGFISELQKRINLLADEKGTAVSGVKVAYDRITNSISFTSGTTGADSFIQVSGSATWGLSSGPSGRGDTTSWIKPTQYTDYSTGQPQKKYINNLGVETSSADGYAGLPEWSPIYLEKGRLTFDTSGKLLSPLSGAQLDTVFLPDGKGSLTININYSKSTQYSSPFAVLSQSQDGAPEGEMVGVSIGDDGLVNASYSNGSQKSLGKIVLVNFTNPSGLRQIGGSSYYSSSSSGSAKYGEAGGAGFGTIRAGATERANVDLTQELVDLITAQRNFQASAKAIETSSSLTQTITNIRS
jgi:flagellar hook-basal body protein